MGLWRLSLLPLDGLNVYLLGDVLVDSGARATAPRLLRAIKGIEIAAHALTHAHMDHQGASHAVCLALNVPLWCGEGDQEAMESGAFTGLMPDPNARIARLAQFLSGPAHPVARGLREGDKVGGFIALETPGHTPGHLSFWRESDRALVAGDVFFHRDPLTFRRGLREPYRSVTFDPGENRASARRLAALQPAVICFGHGPPLRNGEVLARFVAGLRGA